MAARDVNHPFHFSPFISPFYLPDSSADLSTLSSGELKEEEKEEEEGLEEIKKKGERKGGNGKRAESWFFRSTFIDSANFSARSFPAELGGNWTRGILNLIKSATR